MRADKLRAVIASERPQMRHLLTQMVAREPGVAVVGQAENAIKALSLARSLRPDITLVDAELPLIMGLDAMPLSRISGLDAAMDISQELPRSKVVVLANLDLMVYRDDGDGGGQAYLCSQTISACVPFKLHDLVAETAPAGNLVFARVEVSSRVSARQKTMEISDKGILYGGLAILGGLGLMLTFIMAAAGFVLALAGAASLVLGLAGRAVAAWWPKRAAPVQRTVEEPEAKKQAA